MLPSGTFPRAPLLAMLTGRYTRTDANTCAAFCHNLARAAVRARMLHLGDDRRAGVLEAGDVIQECFVQLFRRDGAGRFTEMERFFQRSCPDPAAASDAFLLVTLRRLISAKVSNGVVSVLCKSDPSLCRLLRNLRLAVKGTGLFVVVERFGEDHLRAAGLPPRLHLPLIPPDLLKERLATGARSGDGAPAMLRRVHAVLAEAEDHQPLVPLVGLGIILRGVYAGEPDREDEEMHTSDVARLLPGLLDRIRTRWEPSYVGRGKLTAEEFAAVLACLARIIPDPDGDGGSYFDCLAEHVPGLTKEEYARKYRTPVEYLARTARRELALMLRR